MDHLQEALDQAKRRRALPAPDERRRLRVSAGVSQSAVAACVGITRSTISRYESGDRAPSPPILSKYLGVLERLAGAKTSA